MFGMIGVFAEFERSMIAEPVRAGVARAKDSGVQPGRPRRRPVGAQARRRNQKPEVIPELIWVR
jgi:DNA invertase Pin-like site-specific DNA recombinase